MEYRDGQLLTGLEIGSGKNLKNHWNAEQHMTEMEQKQRIFFYKEGSKN